MVKDYDYPVCFNFPVGHVKNNWPMLEGMKMNLVVTERDVVLKPGK